MKLEHVIYGWRVNGELTLRDAAKIIGITHLALHRFESGKPISQDNFSKVLRWLLSEQ
jgi:hypothetical protein